ncbi:MAG: O-antigen ligase family protein [Terriglobales bacterium]
MHQIAKLPAVLTTRRRRKALQRSLLYVIIALLPLGHLGTLRLFQGTRKAATTQPIEVVLVATIIILLIDLFRPGAQFAGRGGTWRWLLLFPAWGVSSLVYNGEYVLYLSRAQIVFASLYAARWLAYATLYFTVSQLLLLNPRVAVRVVNGLLAGAVAFVLFGIYQATYLPNFAFMIAPREELHALWDLQGHRLVSTLLDPNIAAAYISVFAILAFSFYIYGFGRRWLLAFCLLSAGLVATLSRGGVLGFLVGALALAAVARRRRIFTAYALGLGALIAAFPHLLPLLHHFHRLSATDFSARTRYDDWLLAYHITSDHPITGIGFNALGFVRRRYGAVMFGPSAFGLAGDLFLIPTLTGVIGLAIYATMIGGVCKSANRARRLGVTRWERALGAGVLGATTGAVVSSLFTTVLTYPQVAAALWMLWAIVDWSAARASPLPKRPAAYAQPAIITAAF